MAKNGFRDCSEEVFRPRKFASILQEKRRSPTEVKVKQADCLQGSIEWKEWKKLRIGGSEAASVMGINPWCSPLELWKRKLGIWPEKETNYFMRRGVELEPLALKAFMNMTGIEMESQPNPFIHAQFDYLIASLDGISHDRKNAVEIKCSDKCYRKAIHGIIDPHYVCQLQHQMSVCNLDMIYYFAFDGRDGRLLECIKDDKYISNMIEYEKKFYQCLIDLVEPSYPEGVLGEEFIWM
jgi:putative phage-type endonuclease